MPTRSFANRVQDYCWFHNLFPIPTPWNRVGYPVTDHAIQLNISNVYFNVQIASSDSILFIVSCIDKTYDGIFEHSHDLHHFNHEFGLCWCGFKVECSVCGWRNKLVSSNVGGFMHKAEHVFTWDGVVLMPIFLVTKRGGFGVASACAVWRGVASKVF